MVDNTFGLSDSVLQWWTPVGDTQHGSVSGVSNCYMDTQACGEFSLSVSGTYGLSQALTTVAGQSYFVSVAYNVEGGTVNADNTVTLAVDNSAGTSATANGDLLPYHTYHTLATHFVASSETTTLTLSIGTAGADGVLIFLSGVTVETCSQQLP